MSRRPGTASSSAAAKRKPRTLDTFIQAAISANAPTRELTPKSPRRRRKKQQKALPTAAKVDSVAPPSAKAKRRKRKSKCKSGKTATCVWELQNGDKKVVLVDGMLTPDELEDPDEAADVEEEMTQLFTKYGEVGELRFERTGQMAVAFRDGNDAQKAVEEMDGSHYGGRLIFARLEVAEAESAKSAKTNKQVAICIEQTREEAELQMLVGTFLKRLSSLQERAHAQNPRHDRRLRRLVLGMHEVRRGLLNSKIRLLVVATDGDGGEAVAEKYAELVAIATEKEVPVVSPMNRRKLGRVLQKSVRVSCVGVYSVEGANDLFQQILRTMGTTILDER